MNYLIIIVSAVLVNNIVLMQFLGICPFLGVSRRISTAAGMGGAVAFVMVLSTMVTWLIGKLVLEPLEITYLRTIAFILIIAALVQLVEIILKKVSPALYQALGIYLPLITTNCTILGVALLTVQKDYNLLQGIVFAFSNAVGFSLALIMFAGIREHLELMNIPEGLRGIPIALITTGILAMAFMGFSGLI